MCGRSPTINREQKKALLTIYEGFGRKFAANLASILRADVDANLTHIGLLAYREFVCGLPNPTFMNLLYAKTLPGSLIFNLNPSVLYPMLDQILGEREPTLMAHRSLLEIEQQLAIRITNIFLQELKNVWKNIVNLEFEVIQTKNNPFVTNDAAQRSRRRYRF